MYKKPKVIGFLQKLNTFIVGTRNINYVLIVKTFNILHLFFDRSRAFLLVNRLTEK